MWFEFYVLWFMIYDLYLHSPSKKKKKRIISLIIQESLSISKEIQWVNPKGNQSWIFIGRTDAEGETPNTLATWCKELTPWKSPWCWERSKAGGEGDIRGWDGWMASLTRCTQVWVNSRSWWWTGKPGMLQAMESQRVGHYWVTELNSYTNCTLLSS